MKTCVYVKQYLAEVFLEWAMFHTKSVEKIKAQILCLITFFRNSCRSWDNVEKYGRDGEATNYNIRRNMAHALCKLDNQG
jgi:hypothetical protein